MVRHCACPPFSTADTTYPRTMPDVFVARALPSTEQTTPAPTVAATPASTLSPVVAEGGLFSFETV